jgi:hypothetical protein
MNLPIIIENLDISSNDCSICFEKIEDNINSCITECRHSFHTNCLIKAISFTGFSCPICRKSFENNNTNKNILVNEISSQNYDIVTYDEGYYSDTETNVSDDNDRYEFVTSNFYNDADIDNNISGRSNYNYRFIPSVHYITQQLINQSYPLENFICLALMEHEEYTNEQSSFVSSNANVYNTIKNIIQDYRLEQENSIF